MKEFDKTDLQIKQLFDSLQSKTNEHEFIRKTMRSLPDRQGYLRPVILTLSLLIACGLILIFNKGQEFDIAIYVVEIEKSSATLASFLKTLPQSPLQTVVASLTIASLAIYGSYRCMRDI